MAQKKANKKANKKVKKKATTKVRKGPAPTRRAKLAPAPSPKTRGASRAGNRPSGGARGGGLGGNVGAGLRGSIDAREMFWNNVIRDILMSLSVMKMQHDEAIRVAHAEAVVRAQTARDESGRLITGPHFDGAPAYGGGMAGLDGVTARHRAAASPDHDDPEGTDDENPDAADDGEETVRLDREDATLARALAEGIELSGLPPFDGRMGVVTTQGVRIGIADVYPLFACTIGQTDLERALSEDVQCSVFQIRSPQGEVFTLPVHEIRSFHSLSEELMDQIASAASGEDAEGTRTNVPFGFGAFTSLARAAEARTDATKDAGVA